MRHRLLLPDLKALVAEDNHEALREFLSQVHPHDAAELLEDASPEEVWEILSPADPEQRAEILGYLDLDQQAEVASTLPPEAAARLVEEMPHDERADLVQHLEEATARDLVAHLEEAERRDVEQLTRYQEGTAGAVMTTDFAVLAPGVRVGEAFSELRRQAPKSETIYYLYVLDKRRQLLGVLSLRDLLVADEQSRIEEVMRHTPVVTVRPNTDQEEVARLMARYDLLAVPVVDEGGAMVGIVTHDDVFDILETEHTEDLEKFMGLTGEPGGEAYLEVPVMAHFRRRAGWIVLLGALGLLTATIIKGFAGVLEAVVVLAAFIPMVNGAAGNTGGQAATMVVRALALHELAPAQFLHVLWKELRVAFLIVLLLGSVTFAIVLLLCSGMSGSIRPIHVALTVVLAQGLQVTGAMLIGAMLPLLASRLRLDPAAVASPALQTCGDITGLLLYFATAKVMLGL